MRCPRCSESILPGSRFCPHCGAAASKPPAELLDRPWPVTLLAVVNWAAAALYLLACLAVMAVRPDTFDLLTGSAAFAWIAISVACGYGLLGLHAWGRTLQLIKAWIGLIAFPLGTVLSILILVYLLPRRSKILFSGRKIEALTPEEIGLLQKPASAVVAVVLVVTLGGLMMVSIVGIIAAVAIPNLLNAIDRGKQKRTMVDMRSIATAIEEYAIDHDDYPRAADLSELAAVLEGEYLEVVPARDGWEHEIRFRALVDPDSGLQGYALVSPAKDGVFENDDPALYAPRTTVDFDRDIVLVNGEFRQQPRGMLQ